MKLLQSACRRTLFMLYEELYDRGKLIMVSKNIIVQNEEGIHLRPASMLVDQANKFRSRIRLQSGEHERNCKSLMSLLAFPICPGTEVTIQCEGEDEEEALKAMLDCIHKLKEIQPETKG